MKNINNALIKPAALVVLSAVLLAACGGQENGDAPASGAAPQVPVVTVLTVKAEAVPMMAELPGRTSPSRMFEIGPGENVPYPHLGKKLSQRRYDRRVRTQQRIAQASAAMGPFAVAAAQVMR